MLLITCTLLRAAAWATDTNNRNIPFFSKFLLCALFLHARSHILFATFLCLISFLTSVGRLFFHLNCVLAHLNEHFITYYTCLWFDVSSECRMTWRIQCTSECTNFTKAKSRWQWREFSVKISLNLAPRRR